MTNGRLERWVTEETARGKKRKTVKKITEGCPAFFTSTTKDIEEQYASRNWICHTTTTDMQTVKIHKYQTLQDAVPKEHYKKRVEAREFLTKCIRYVMQNTKPVLIPFVIGFPFHEPRMRRDRPKFTSLIKNIANWHMLQRKTVTCGETTYIVAEVKDFEIAKQVASPFLRETFLSLNKEAIEIFDLMKEKANVNSVKEINSELSHIGESTIRRRLNDLDRKGFVSIDTSGKTYSYSLTKKGKREEPVTIPLVDNGNWVDYETMRYEEIVAQIEVIYDRWAESKRKQSAKVTLELCNLSKKDRNQAIIKKEAQNKLNNRSKNRSSIVPDHNIKGKKIDEYPIEDYKYTKEASKKKKKEE